MELADDSEWAVLKEALGGLDSPAPGPHTLRTGVHKECRLCRGSNNEKKSWLLIRCHPVT